MFAFKRIFLEIERETTVWAFCFCSFRFLGCFFSPSVSLTSFFRFEISSGLAGKGKTLEYIYTHEVAPQCKFEALPTSKLGRVKSIVSLVSVVLY